MAVNDLKKEKERLEALLAELDGCALYEAHPRVKGQVRETPAGKLYRQYMALYLSVCKTLGKTETEKESSPLRDYLASRVKGGEINE